MIAATVAMLEQQAVTTMAATVVMLEVVALVTVAVELAEDLRPPDLALQTVLVGCFFA